MPALPEVEVLRRDLEKEIVGRRIKEAEVRQGSNAMKVIPRHGRRKEFEELLVGAKFEHVSRKGVRLVLDLDTGNSFVVFLGSGGQLLKTSASDDIASHTHLVISFTIGGHLRYIDPRLEGELYVAPRDDVENDPELSSFLIDPLETPLAWQHFSNMLEERAAPLKEILLDQEFIVGIDSMYCDEILFTSGLRHDHPSNNLSSQDVRRLYRALVETLQEAVKLRGTSLPDGGFVDLNGVPGGYQVELKIFERKGESCRRCRNEVEMEVFNGVETFFCPQCQS